MEVEFSFRLWYPIGKTIDSGEILYMIKRKNISILAALFTALFLTACGTGLPIVSEVGGSQSYKDEQAMIVIATERNRYRDIYTDQIWQIQVDEAGTTFQAYLLSEIRDFMTELRTMNLLADEKDIRLSGQEKEQLRKLAEAYYDSLTAEDREYIGAGEDDIYELYEQYHRANKLVDELTGDVNLEISDSEAKVITVQEIVVSDEERAMEIHRQVAEEGADFLSEARSVSEDTEIEKQVGRSERPKAYEDEVFSLNQDEISPVFSMDGMYYIVKCINDYDEAATLERKQRLALQRKSQAFRQIYDEFSAEYPVDIKGDIWSVDTLAKGSGSTTTSFFTQYQETMNQ